MDYNINTTFEHMVEQTTSGIGDTNMDALARTPIDAEISKAPTYFNALINRLESDNREFQTFTSELYNLVGSLFEISQPKHVEFDQVVENKFDQLYEAYMFRAQLIENLYHLCDQMSLKIDGENFDYELKKLESKDDIICLKQYDEIFEAQFGVIYDLLRYLNSSVNPFFNSEPFEIDPIDFKGPNYMFHIILEGNDFLLKQCERTITHLRQIF